MKPSDPLLHENSRKSTNVGVWRLFSRIIFSLVVICVATTLLIWLSSVLHNIEENWKSHHNTNTGGKSYTNINIRKDIDSKRIVIYYSPNESPDSNEISLSEIANNINEYTEYPFITVVEISTLHLKKYDSSEDTYIKLNDYSPYNSIFDDTKTGVKLLQSSGILVFFMIGGAEGTTGTAPESDSTWVNLFNDDTMYDLFYHELKNTLIDWGVDGIDLDIENSDNWSSDENDENDESGVSNYDNVCKLLKQLKEDEDLGGNINGEEFYVVMAPVAEAIYDNDKTGGMSGFDYKKLINDKLYGQYINWFNVQFYNHWGNLRTGIMYDEAILNENYDSRLLVAGMQYVDDVIDDSNENCTKISQTIEYLSNKYDNFGGVFVWKGNDANVLQWSHKMYQLMHN